MTKFLDRFENHPIHSNLQELNKVVIELLEEETKEAEIIELDRIKQVLLLLNDRLNNCDPNTVNIAMINTVQNNCLPTVKKSLNNFVRSRSISNLHNANNHLDAHIKNIYNISTLYPLEVEGIKDSIISFRRSVAQHLRHSEEEYNKLNIIKNELEQGFNQVASTVDVQKGRLDTAISEFQQQFSNAEESRRNKYFEEVDKRKNDFEQFKIDWKEDFKQFEDKTELIIKEISQNLINENEELQKAYIDESQQHLATLQTYKEKAAQVLNIISNTSMAGGYKQVANQEQTSRKFWRTITMIAMISLIIVAIYSFFKPFGDSSIWIELAKRISIAGTFAIVAGYASRQAKVHLDAERLYRRLELELTSLSPYLVELDDEKRKEILAKMTENFFGKANFDQSQTDSTPQGNTEPELSNSITELSKILESILSLVKK